MSDSADPKDVRGDIGDANLELENADAMSTRVEVEVSQSDKGGGVIRVLGASICG
jgi:hypothetical protein